MKPEPAAAGEDAILAEARKQTLSPVGATENEQSSGESLFDPTHDEFSRRYLSPRRDVLHRDGVAFMQRVLIFHGAACNHLWTEARREQFHAADANVCCIVTD